MTEKILVPNIGDFKNVEIIEVLVKEGDKINKGDVNNIELEIRLIANPISDDLLGVISL